jgi:hypothetical protein
LPESLQDEDGMGRTKGSLWVASREEPGAGPFGGFSTIRWQTFAGARRADLRMMLTPTVQQTTQAVSFGEGNGLEVPRVTRIA